MKYSATFLLLVVIGFASACSEHVGSIPPDVRTQDDHITEFWQWFKQEHTVLETMPDSSRVRHLNIVLEHLAPIASDLAVEVSKESHGVRDIVISADGDKNKFSVVEKIVTAAPKIPGWTVTAFRQKAKEEFVLTYENLKFSPAEMLFHPVIEGDSLDVLIYADSVKHRNRDDIIKYGLITIDNVLGEYAATLKVRSYDFRDSQEIEPGEQVYKLKGLPDFVDRFYAEKHMTKKK